MDTEVSAHTLPPHSSQPLHPPQPQNPESSQPQNPESPQPQNPQSSQPQNPQSSQPQNPQSSQNLLSSNQQNPSQNLQNLQPPQSGHNGSVTDDLQIEQLSTMTLSEFRKLINTQLSVPQTPDPPQDLVPQSPSEVDDIVDGTEKRSKSVDPHTSSWALMRDKARSVCSSVASRLTGKKGSGSGGGIIARRNTPKSSSTGPNNALSAAAERPKTPASTVDRPKTPVATRSKTPVTSTYAYRPKTPTANSDSSIQRPKTPSRSKTPTANLHSTAAYGSRLDDVSETSSLTSDFQTTTTVESKIVISVTYKDSVGYVDNALETLDLEQTRRTGLRASSSEHDECQSLGGSSNNAGEDERSRQISSVTFSKDVPSSASKIPKPSFIPRSTTPAFNNASESIPTRCRPSLSSRQSSMERQASVESGDDERRFVSSTRRPQTPGSSIPAPGNSYYKMYQARRAKTPGPDSSQPSVNTARSTTPGPDVTYRRAKASPGGSHLTRTGSQTSRINKKIFRRSRSLTDLLQGVDILSLGMEHTNGDDSCSNGTLPRTSTSSKNKLRSQKSCEADSDDFVITRNEQGQHIVQKTNGTESHKQSRAGSYDADRVRSKTPGPRLGLKYQQRNIIRKPRQSVQTVATAHSKIFNRTEAWVDSTLHDPKRKQSSSLRRPMTPNSLSIAESELLSRPLEEIQAALPSPSKLPPVTDPEDISIAPEDPEMYRKMEMLFEKYREMELRASVRDTPGGSQESTSGSASKSPSSHVSSGGRGQGVPGTSASSLSSSSVKASAAVNTYSSCISSVRSFETDSSRSMSVEREHVSRDSSPSRPAVSLCSNGSVGTSDRLSQPHIVNDPPSACVTPRPQQTFDPIDNLSDVDAETAKNPSALVSKIKEILQVRPRKDKEKSGLRTRIPAPTPVSQVKRSVASDGSGLHDTPVRRVHEATANGCDESTNSDVSSECSRSETPVPRTTKGKAPLSKVCTRLFDRKTTTGPGSDFTQDDQASNASSSASSRQPWDEDEEIV